MQGRMVIAVVTLTLGLLLTTSHADDAMRSVPTMAQERAGSVVANSAGFLNSLRDADDGEYVIFNSKGDPEAAVVVTKDAAKATEESNIRSIYEWMHRYIEKNKNAVTTPNQITAKKTPFNYHPRQNYAPEYYGPSPYAPAPYAPPPFAQAPYNPVAPYTPYRPASGYYPGSPPYQYGYPQEFYNYQAEPSKVIKAKKPYVTTHTEIITGANKRPLHVYNVAPSEYAWSVVQKGPKEDEVIRGAHTTPNGKPWPPARKIPKNQYVSSRFPFFQQNDQEGYMRYSDMMSDAVAVERYPTRSPPGYQQAIAPSKNMFYRSWLAGQVEGSPFYGSNVNYDDEAMSAYLMAKFAPLAEPQAYGVRSNVVKTKKKNNNGAKKGPVGYLPVKQNGKRYSSPRPQFYSVEAVEATPQQMYSRYGEAAKDGGLRFWQNDGSGSLDSQQTYTVQGLDGVMHGNPRFDALKALTGYSRGQIDQMIDGRRGNDYMRFYSPQAVEAIVKKYGGAKYPTGYATKNSNSMRTANVPQLYLFPSVNRNTQTVSLYGGAKPQGVVPNGYMDVMRNINSPPRYQMEAPKPVVYKAPNQRFVNAYPGYGNDMSDQGRNVDYKNLLTFIRGMNGVSNKTPKLRQKSPMVKSRPQYFIVEEPDNVQGQKYDNVRAMSGYTKAQISKIIANNMMKQGAGAGGARYKTQTKYASGVEPWQQFRNSERSYPQYDQPWRETFAVRPPVMGYGY